MFKFGDIVLARFPFTDLSGGKLRPALIVSRDNSGPDLILAFITSKTQVVNANVLQLSPSKANGLKTDSVVRFDKLATLEASIVVGKLGVAEPAFLKKAGPVFFRVFGFDPN
jgi:mRNA interferase MazF